MSSPYIKNLDSWKKLGSNVTTDNAVVASEADLIILAVKPHMLKEAIDTMSKSSLQSKIKNKLFMSILAGLTTKHLEDVRKIFIKLKYRIT